MLPPEELRRRIDAARTLKGLRQSDLAQLLVEDGHGKHDVGRLERGDIPLSRALKHSLAEHLGVPEEWFTADSIDPGQTHGVDIAARLDALEAKLTARTNHDQVIAEMLEQQTAILQQIEIALKMTLQNAGLIPQEERGEGPAIPRYPRQRPADRRQASEGQQ